MTAIMAKERKNPRGRPKGRKETVSMQLRVSPEMADALERLSERCHRTRNQEAIYALEKHLTEAGEWPPPESPT